MRSPIFMINKMILAFSLLFWGNLSSAANCSKLLKQFTQLANQAKYQPHFFKVTNLTMNKLMSASNLDKHVFDMYGHLNLGLPTSSLRPWKKDKPNISDAKPSDIIGIDPAKWAGVARLAADIEEPINAYSDNSGNTLQLLSPQASKFMGKTTPQSQYRIKEKLGLDTAPSEEEVRAQARKIPRREYCSNPWCDEEARHEGILETLADNVDPEGKVARGGVFDAYDGLSPTSMDDAYFHLISRSDTEWHAGSAYLWLFAHSSGATQQWISDVLIDELKHQALFAGLFKYLRGDDYAGRLKVMLKKMAEEISQKSKSEHIDVNKEPLAVLEIAYIHIKYELLIQKFLKTIPLKTLRKVYETNINLPDLPAIGISQKDRIIRERLLSERKKIRKDLGDWKPKHRSGELELEEFEKNNDKTITAIIEKDFDFFKGAETHNDDIDLAFRAKIDKLNSAQIHSSYGVKLSKKELDLLKRSLRANLRDYQIFNNETVRAEEMTVSFINALEGFKVTPKSKTLELKIIGTKKVSETYSMIRIERPYLMALEAGDALRVTIKSQDGENKTRVLSLASSPTEPYIEVAVTNSDSSFKQAFLKLKENDSIQVEKITSGAGLKYQEDKPAVMIAGGIGITPIRSIIHRHQSDSTLDKPIKLMLGSRGTIPFKKEFDDLSIMSNKFDVSYFVSNNKNTQDVNINSGRLTKSDLQKVVSTQKDDTIYYVVAPENMQNEVTKNLEELGISKSRIVVESFGASSTVIPTKQVDNAPKANDSIVCACNGVTRGEILDSILLGTATKAATGCGACSSVVQKIKDDMDL